MFVFKKSTKFVPATNKHLIHIFPLGFIMHSALILHRSAHQTFIRRFASISIVLVTLLLAILCFQSASGQEAKGVPQRIDLFSSVPTSSIQTTPRLQRASEAAFQHFKRFELLTIQPASLRTITSRKQGFSFTLPHSKKQLVISVQPYNPFTTTARFIAKTPEGDVEIVLDDDFVLYRGIVEGDKTSLVSMSASRGGVLMTIRTARETLTLEQVPNSESDSPQTLDKSLLTEDSELPFVLYSTADNKRQRTFLCGAEEQTDEHGEEGSAHQPSTPIRQLNDKNTTSVQALQECEMGIDIDFATYQSLGSSQTQAAQYAAAVIAAVSQIYERDINTRLAVSYVQVWTSADPYSNATTTGAALSQFAQTWNSNYTSINRDLAHLFSVRGLGGGVAYLDVLCNKTRGYGLSANLRARFPIDPAWTTYIVAHEIGHNFGSRHTHSCWWQGGAIDRCAPAEAVSGQAPCFTTVVASRGTIMSYCHLQAGGVANIDMNFHPLCISYMRSRAEAASCLGSSSGGGGGIVQSVSVGSFSPASGGAGLQVIITGTNFTNVTAVRFGGTNAQSYTVNNSTQITAILGAGATGQVQVVTATGSANSSQTFTYTSDVSASVSVISFAPIRVAKEAVQTLTLRNNSTSPVAFAFTALSGANASDFTVVSSSTVVGASLGAGQTQTLTIRYRPSAEGTRTATLNIAYTGKPIVSVSPFMELSASQVTTPPVELGETSLPVHYELRGSYLGSSVLVVAPSDWQLALSSTATASEWASRLEVPAKGTTVNAAIWVRFVSRREGLQTGTITHWAGATSAPLAVSGFTNTSYLSAPQTLDFGTLNVGQSAIAQYYFQATNIGSAVQIQPPSGMALALDDNGPWQSSLTLNPVARTIASTIFVRFEPSTNGVVTGLITHTVGIRSAVVAVQAKVVRELMKVQSLQISSGVLNFGYVAPRYTSIATYWLEITNATTAVTIQSPDGFTLALADDGSWSEKLVIPPPPQIGSNGAGASTNTLRRLIFVRFAPRFRSVFAGALTHSVNGTIATVRVFGTSIEPKLGVETRVLDFGRLQANTSATRSYRIQAEGITTPITVQMPRGLLAALSEHDSWRESLVFTPLQGQATLTILVRTKPEIATGQTYSAVIDNFATDNNFFVQSTIAAVANIITRAVTQNSTSNTVNSGNQVISGGQSSLNQATSVQRSLAPSIDAAQSYPNPFSDVISLSWKQSKIGNAKIVISSAHGTITRVLATDASRIGQHSIEWDGRDDAGNLAASGMYFAQITIDSVHITQNLILLLVR
jgi:Metallo-peptidase family M12/IPT/TIG domain/FlgD Ig-like domain/Abnormal spindle-like microcephaly-assoc'd, ASPM-SPD-2-Hydin